MDGHVEQDFEAEEGSAPEVKRSRRKKPEAPAPASGHERDQGDWKFRPWKGIDHWVHERTGASTFDLKKIK